jgi:hypothetical protein
MFVEAKHGVKRHPKDLGRSAEGDVDTIDGDIRLGVELQVVRHEEDDLGLVCCNLQLLPCSPLSDRGDPFLKFPAKGFKVRVRLQSRKVISI